MIFFSKSIDKSLAVYYNFNKLADANMNVPLSALRNIMDEHCG